MEMKKENIYRFLYAVCILLTVGFAVRLGADYYTYDSINNSAPFYACIIERFFEFMLPGIILFVVGTVMKKKYAK